MDCNCNQRSAGSCRPQMPPPPCMNTNCGCVSQTPMPPIQPRMVEPDCVMPGCGGRPGCNTTPGCGVKPACGIRPGGGTVPPCGVRPGYNSDPINMPIAMAYVPWQQWRQTYPMDKALIRGTVFPELDLPFVMGRCR